MATTSRAMLLGDANDILDEEGRPIGEVRAGEEVRRGVPTQYMRCPYTGSRSKVLRLMNASALNQLLAVWPRPLTVLQAVRACHGTSVRGEPGLLDLCRVTFAVLCLPAWLAFHRRPVPVPVHVAVAHKMCQGLFGLCKNLLIERVGAGEDHRTASTNLGDLYRYAERSGMLLSRTGIEACAAPPAFIGEALRVLTQGSDGRHDDPPDVMFMRPAGEGVPLFDYARGCADMTLWVTVTAIALRRAMEHGSTPDIDWCEFGDPVVGLVPELPDVIRSSYADGALGLCSNPETHQRLARILSCGDAPAIEEASLSAFDELQHRVLSALGRDSLPPQALSSTVRQAFSRRAESSAILTADHV